jgi:predicted ATPase/DNA-binding SARP family transcriptional activator
MHINLLGSCQIIWQGRPLSIPRRQTRALLYYLAARLEPAPRAQLAFLFWPDIPDAAARRKLTRLLSGLRAALPQADLLLVDEDSVTLNPILVKSDSQQFMLAVRSGDPVTLAAAASLYRGPFMAGFELADAPEYDGWQAATARQLETSYLGVLEQLVVHHRAMRDYPAAIDYARQYLTIDDLAETMHRSLIDLYMIVGDRAAGQRQYEQCALVLERELGVSPLPETQSALHATPPPQPAINLIVQPSLDLPLIGREATLDQLQSAYQRLHRGGVILLHGPPGIGKTRLVREFALQESDKNLVLAGASYSGGQTLPYHPLLQALHTSFDLRDQWAAVPAAWLSELLPMMPDLRSALPDLSAPLPAAPGQAQARVFAAFTQTLRALAVQVPVLLCLDDLHWADEGTLGWLQFLANRWEDAPLVILATCHRPSAPTLAAARQALRRGNRLVEIELTGLEIQEVQHLLSGLAVPPSADLTERLHRISSGNPFFVLELARELQECGQIGEPPPDLPLPATVREAILTRVSYLTPIARQVLEAAAVLHPLLDDELLQHTSARSAVETSDALDELLTHQFLQINQEPTNQDQLVFPHSLMQLAVYRELSPWRRKLLHRRVGDELVRIHPQNATALAHHFAEAAAWELSIAYYQQAAAQATQAAAYETALELIQRAFDLLSHLPHPEPIRLGLLRQRLLLQRVLVRLDGWESDAKEVLRLAARARDDNAQLDALQAQISLNVLQSDFSRIEVTAAQALALAQEMGNQVAEASIRQTLGWHLTDALARSAEGLAHLQEACRLAEAAGAENVLYQALCNLAFAQRAEGQCQAARDSALRALALTSYQPGLAPQPAFADAQRELGEANAYLGRWQEALSLLRPLLELYQTLNDPWNYGAVLHNYGLYCAGIGLHAEAVTAMRQLVALSEAVGLPAGSDYGIWHRAGLARVLLSAGKTVEAGELLAALDTSTLKPGRPYLAWVRATAKYQLAIGDAAAALAIVQPAVDWWRRSASLHDVDVLLLLAQSALAAGVRSLALVTVDEATARLAGSDMARHLLRLHSTRYAVTSNPADLAAFQAELARQADGFNHQEMRAVFIAWAGGKNAH